jgi:hypothetical protein
MDNVFALNKSLIRLLLSCCIFLFFSCSSKVDQFFEAKIDGILWQAKPHAEFERYNLKYKPLSHQLSIFAVAKDSSWVEISFHAPNQLQVGNYPSVKNDNGIQSGIFYFPKDKNSAKQMASITYEDPIQENTININKIDKSNPAYYIIEGTFSCTLYALYANNLKKRGVLTSGRFKVLYYLDSDNPAF